MNKQTIFSDDLRKCYAIREQVCVVYDPWSIIKWKFPVSNTLVWRMLLEDILKIKFKCRHHQLEPPKGK